MNQLRTINYWKKLVEAGLSSRKDSYFTTIEVLLVEI